MTKRKTPRRNSSATDAARYRRAVEQGRADDPVTRYALDVQRGAIIAGPWVRLAAERHLGDLERRKFTWDLEAARRAIRFFPTVLRLNGGQFEGKPFTLEPWQQFIIGSIFGWKRADGTRRFRTAFCEIGKGNGKSPLAAGVGHLMLLADDEPRAEIYAAAGKKEQAQIIFRDAVTMRDQSPALKKRLTPSGNAPHTWNLADHKSGSYFRPISSDNKQSGLRPHCALIDEIHEHDDPNTVQMMRAGVKGRRQPLIFEITNSGFDRTSVCWDHHDYSTRVLQGVHRDEAWFAYVCALDDGDDWTDERVWLKANPNLGVSIQVDYLRAQVNEALGMPSIQNITKRLNFCIWTDAESVGIPVDQWKDGTIAVDPAALAGRECFLGLDLSTTTDLTSAQLYFPGVNGGKAQLLRRYWMPSSDLKERCLRDKVPYDAWIRDGHITATQGNSIDYAFIRAELNRLAQTYRVREVAYDPFNATHLVTELQGDGFTVAPVRQTFPGLSAATKELLRLVAARELAHGGDPVLAWMAANVALDQDPVGNIRPNKRKSAGRIDGIVALVMAIDRASRHGMIPRSIYEDRHLYDERAAREDSGGETGAAQDAAARRAPAPLAALPPIPDSTTAAQPVRPTRSIYDSEEWNQLGEELTR